MDKGQQSANLNWRLDEQHVYTYWKDCEDVAMHFNELLINFRTRTLSAIAGAVAIAGTILVSGSFSSMDLRTRLFVLTGLLIFFLFIWTGFWAIDRFYYESLLRGAVDEIIEIEKASNGTVNLSRRIEIAVIGPECMRHSNVPWVKGKTLYYSLTTISIVCAAITAFLVAVHIPPHADKCLRPNASSNKTSTHH